MYVFMAHECNTPGVLFAAADVYKSRLAESYVVIRGRTGSIIRNHTGG